MRLSTNHFLLIVIAFLLALFLIFIISGPDHNELAPIPQSQNNASIDTGPKKPLIFDRKNILLTSTSTTKGTTLLLKEMKSKLSDIEEMHLTIDSELQDYVYGALEDVALSKGYAGGAGVVMDIRTGELLVLTSYSKDNSSLNRATNGLLIPGSIIKPFIAIAALNEGLIDPSKEILSTGSITLTDQNGKKLLFNDWKAHGYVNMREAIGVSSNVYFYTIGGGYEDQPGLGIEKIVEYLQMFGVGEITGLNIISESKGQLPTPAWKETEFNGDKWRLADTYLASIGQHGYKVTPLQMTRAVGAIASEGQLIVPRINHDTEAEVGVKKTTIPIKGDYFRVVKEGMEYAVINGTASGLYMNGISLAAKTGTAEADINKEHIHSWLTGYFPYDKPRYVFTFMLDNGPWGEETGAVAVAHNIFEWIREERPEYTSTF